MSDKISNKEEIESLVQAINTLEKYKYSDIFSGFTGTVQKVIDAVEIRSLKKDSPAYDFIDFEKVPFIKGSNYLPKLIEAIKGESTVLLRYQPFHEDKPYMVNLHPYLLKEYRNRWYVIGLNDERGEIRTYSLDRIQLIEFTDRQYISREFCAKDYFKNAVGVISPEGEAPEVVIEVQKPQAYYLLTKPLHESQKQLKEDEEMIRFSFKVHPTYEFKVLLLALGSDAKVLQPASFRDDMLRSLKQALEGYSN